MSNPNDPYGQQGQPAQPGQPAPADYGQQQYYGQQQPYQGYTAPAKKPLELAKIVTIAAWVVLGLYGLSYLYSLTQSDTYGGDFGDRFFGGMTGLGQGIFYAGALLALGVWLDKQKASD